MMRTAIGRLGLLALVAAVVPACGDGTSAPSSAIDAAQTVVGPRGFTFLPPLVHHPVFNGVFQPGLAPVVQIDLLGAGGQPPTPTATLTDVREEGEAYAVLWKTRHFDLDPHRIYRLRVLLDGDELGSVDVEVLSSSQCRNRHTGDVFPLHDGRTLPIRFWIAKAIPHGGPPTITRLSNGSPEDQQNMPVISGTRVVWTNVSTPAGGPSNFDLYYYDLTTGGSVNLTNTPADQEFLEDIDGDNVVWTHTGAGIPGDIVVYNLATNTLNTIAGSNSSVHFEQPSIRGNRVAFLRVGAQIDVFLYDLMTGPVGLITNDAAVQGRPRVGGDFVVYEDYTNGDADIRGYRISTAASFPIATGPDDQLTPDLDGNTVVYVQRVNGSDQIFTYDLVSGVTTQRTTSTSSKILPRISGTRIVWSDDRSGNLDLYLYDLSTGHETALVTGAGDQFLADLDGDRVVYTDNSAGFEQVYLLEFHP